MSHICIRRTKEVGLHCCLITKVDLTQIIDARFRRKSSCTLAPCKWNFFPFLHFLTFMQVEMILVPVTLTDEARVRVLVYDP